MIDFRNKAKLIKVAAVLCSISVVGLIIWILSIAVGLGDAVLPLLFAKQAAFALRSVTTIPMCVLAFGANLHIYRFFKRLKKGNLFDARTVGALNSASNWWIAIWLYEMACWSFGHGLTDHATATSSIFSGIPLDVGLLFGGLTLKFFAWLLREAQELQEEHGLTI